MHRVFTVHIGCVTLFTGIAVVVVDFVGDFFLPALLPVLRVFLHWVSPLLLHMPQLHLTMLGLRSGSYLISSPHIRILCHPHLLPVCLFLDAVVRLLCCFLMLPLLGIPGEELSPSFCCDLVPSDIRDCVGVWIIWGLHLCLLLRKQNCISNRKCVWLDVALVVFVDLLTSFLSPVFLLCFPYNFTFFVFPVLQESCAVFSFRKHHFCRHFSRSRMRSGSHHL